MGFVKRLSKRRATRTDKKTSANSAVLRPGERLSVTGGRFSDVLLGDRIQPSMGEGARNREKFAGLPVFSPLVSAYPLTVYVSDTRGPRRCMVRRTRNVWFDPQTMESQIAMSVETFEHERLVVYQLAIEFLATAEDLVEHLPPRREFLAGELGQAAVATPLLIAEGASGLPAEESQRLHRQALRSAARCAALLDVLRRLALAEAGPLSAARRHLVRLIDILSGLVRRREEATGPTTRSE